MGVTHLWPILKETGSLTELRADRGQHAQIAAHVDGLTVAVDLSTWVMEAQHQLNLKEVFHNDRAQCLKMVFERSLNWLRYGVLPVFVVEGVPPEAKRQLMAKRQALRQGTAPPAPSTQRPSASQQAYRPYTTQFEQMNRHVTDLLDAMGLPWVQACGEAEATCAALSRAGLVDGVQSKDVDTMLFGAEVVYKVLHLQAEVCRLSHLERCTMEGVRSALGLTSPAGTAGGGANGGGSTSISGCRSLIAMAQLAGGDYNKAGATNVGPTIALSSVRTLLKRAGARSDEDVLELLKQALDAGPDQHLLSLAHCTGCKTCGHESGNKSSCKQHGRAGCAGCGTTTGCEPRTFERCGCEFHQREDERWLAKVVARAVGTEHFTRMCEGAAEVYLQQAADAAAAVARLRPRVQEQGGFRWSHRPDAAKLVPLLCPHLDWKPRTLVGKLMPLLVEWDLRQGPQAPFSGGAPAASDVQFCAVAIQKVAGKQPASKQMATQQQGTLGSDGEGEQEAGGAGGEGTVGWRYVLRLETVGSCLEPGRKLPGTCVATAPGRGGSSGGGAGPSGLRGAATTADGAGPSQRGAGAEEGEEEEEEEEREVDLNKESRKWLEGCKSSLRSVRRSLVDAVWPHLEQEKKGGAGGGGAGGGGAGGGAGGAAGNGAKATKKGKAKATGMEGQEGALLRFLKPKRAAVEGEQGAQAGKGKALVEDQVRKGDMGDEGEGEEAGPSQSQAQRGRTQEAGPSQNQAQRGRMQETAAGPSAAAPRGGAPPARARTAVAAAAAGSGGGGSGGCGGGPMDRYLAPAKAGPSGSGGAGGAASAGGSEHSVSAGLSHLIALNKEVLERRAVLAEEEAREREAKRAEAAAARERAEAAAAAAGGQPVMQRSQQRRARGALARAVQAIEILDSGDEEEEKEAPRGSGEAEGRARQQRETGRAQGRAVQAAAAAIEILSSDDDGDGGRDEAGVRQGGGPAAAPGGRPSGVQEGSVAAAGASGSGTEGCNGGSGGGGMSPRPGSGETPMTMAGVAAALSPYKRRISAAEQAEEEAGAGGVCGGPGSGGNLAPRGAVDVGGAGGSGCRDRDRDRDRESLALPAGGEVCEQGGEQQPPAGAAAGSPAKRPRQQQVPRAGQQQQQQQQRPQPCRVGDAGAGGAGHRQGGEEDVIDLTD